MRGNVLQDVVRGVERNRKWPDPRLSNQTPGQKAHQEWFRQCNWAFKFMAPNAQASFIRATHRTSLYPRDVFGIMVSGGLFAWATNDGKVRYPMATKQAVSESLDAITQQLGATLIRGPKWWGPGPVLPKDGVLSTRLIRTTAFPLTTSLTAIPWQVAQFDELQGWDIAAPTKFVVPDGVTRLSAFVYWDAVTASNADCQLAIAVNGTRIARTIAKAWGSAASLSLSTGPMNVVPGDEVSVLQVASSGPSSGIEPSRTAFSLQFG